jgi:hypothetical protein
MPLAALGALGALAIAGGHADSPASGGGSSRSPGASVRSPGGRSTRLSSERVTSSVTYLARGHARLELVSRHPPGLRWGGESVHWYLGTGSSGPLPFVKIGQTRETSRGVTRMTVRVFIPRAGHFRFAACFRAPRQNTSGLPGSHGPCGANHFRGPADSPYIGTGIAPRGYPGPAAIAIASSYLGDRSGYTAFAVIDSEGRIHGRHLHRTFVSASVVKAMLLVAYLRKLAGAHRHLDATSRSILEPMIHLSDNDAATAVWERDGDRRLRTLARRAGMSDFSIEGEWGNAEINAGDQARFFYGMEGLIPKRFRHFANHLLSHIVDFESWGVPAVARPRGWTVFFKGGWRGTWRGQLVHQVSRLVRHRRRVAIAVMTDGDPSMDYGVGTIEGVAARLLGR